MGQKGVNMGHRSNAAGQTAAGQSRARTPSSGGMSRLSRGTQADLIRDTEVVGQDKASTPFRTSSRPTATTDPRFAGWIAGASQEQVDRFAQRETKPLTAEQRELFRQCGERILDSHRLGRKVSPEALADGRRWAAFPKLPHALSSGEPVPDEQLPPALRGGALEVF